MSITVPAGPFTGRTLSSVLDDHIKACVADKNNYGIQCAAGFGMTSEDDKSPTGTPYGRIPAAVLPVASGESPSTVPASLIAIILTDVINEPMFASVRDSFIPIVVSLDATMKGFYAQVKGGSSENLSLTDPDA